MGSKSPFVRRSVAALLLVASLALLLAVSPVTSAMALSQGPNWLGVNCIAAGGGCVAIAPADPGIAVGTSDVVETTNGGWAVYGKSGGVVASRTWFSWLGTPSSDFIGDPYVVWDLLAQHYLMSVYDYTSAVLYIQASQGSTGSGSWCTATVSANKPEGESFDYDKIGADAQNIYVTFDDYGNHVFNGANALYIPKSLESCSSGNIARTYFLKNTDGTYAYSVWPVNEKVQAQEPEGFVEYFVDNRIDQARTSPRYDINMFVIHNASIYATVDITTGQYYEQGVDVPQLNGPNLQMRDDVLSGAFLNDDLSIYLTSTTAANYSGVVKDALWFARLNPANRTVIWANIFADSNSYLAWSGISAFAQSTGTGGVLTFTKSTSSQYPQMLVQQFNTDGSLNGPVLVPFSASQPYTPPSNLCCRWGDFATSAVDPSGPAMYSADEVEYQDSSNWSTWLSSNQ